MPQTIGVANGTDALVLVLDAMGIGPGDEVICPAFTFYATAEAIARRGATPVFADIDPATLNLDPEDVAAPDHADGRRRSCPCTSSAARRRSPSSPRSGCRSIEDAAQAFGAPGIATTGVASTFSFFPTKNLFGARRRRARRRHRRRARPSASGMLRFHGSRDKIDFEFVGYNSRLDEIQAAALRLFLPQLDGWNRAAARGGRALRRARARRARASCPADEPGHVYHLFVVPLARARPRSPRR